MTALQSPLPEHPSLIAHQSRQKAGKMPVSLQACVEAFLQVSTGHSLSHCQSTSMPRSPAHSASFRFGLTATATPNSICACLCVCVCVCM